MKERKPRTKKPPKPKPYYAYYVKSVPNLQYISLIDQGILNIDPPNPFCDWGWSKVGKFESFAIAKVQLILAVERTYSLGGCVWHTFRRTDSEPLYRYKFRGIWRAEPRRPSDWTIEEWRAHWDPLDNHIEYARYEQGLGDLEE